MSYSKKVEARGRLIGDGTEPLICAPVVGGNFKEVLAETAAIAKLKPDLIEWRVDYFDAASDTQRVLDLAAKVRQVADDIPLIFTLRSHREGGEPVTLDDDGVAELCVAVCEAKVADFIDFEMSAPPHHIEQVCAAGRENGTQSILSYHNFQETPDVEWLVAKFGNANALSGDIAKIAVMPQSLDDVLILLQATLRASREFPMPLISISMGGFGAVTRMIAWLFGSSVTFAVGERSSAPGQIAIGELVAVLEILRNSLPSA